MSDRSDPPIRSLDDLTRAEADRHPGRNAWAAIREWCVGVRKRFGPIPDADPQKVADLLTKLDEEAQEQKRLETENEKLARYLKAARQESAIIRRGLEGVWPEDLEETSLSALVRAALKAKWEAGHERASDGEDVPVLGGPEEGAVSWVPAPPRNLAAEYAYRQRANERMGMGGSTR